MQDPGAAGRSALVEGAWKEARAHFESALAASETPEALEGLAAAAWWLGDTATVFDARERAYALYRGREDPGGAARLAIALAVDFNDARGEPAVAKGWLQRARRLLQDVDPVPEHGWLAFWEGLWSLPDTAAARARGVETAELGRSLRVVDLEMAGLALEGLGLVSEGRVTEGMQRLDEASAAAVAGEVNDLSVVGVICCFLIYGCELVRDYDRAAQWCDIVTELAERRGMRHFFAYCRTHYSSVLIWQGAWADAERELLAATDELLVTRAGLAMDGVVRLGELRRLQGRWDEATRLFAQAGGHPLAQLGRAQLALDQGDPRTALHLAERFLRGIPAEDRTERAAGLGLLVRAQTDLGSFEEARMSCAELQRVAATIGTTSMQALAAHTEGVLAVADGAYDLARRRLEDAIDLYERSGAPGEMARARQNLAEALRQLGLSETATQEARLALETLERLGAAKEAERASRFLAGASAAEISSQPEGSPLTPREVEVLRLVAEGLSNHEIATRLVLSEHTVHRHLSNVLRKLDVPSRAAAGAYAVRHGLV